MPDETGGMDEDERDTTLGSPVPERSGPTIDAAIRTAEDDSQAEDDHTLDKVADDVGESRVEGMTEQPVTEPRTEGAPGTSSGAPEPGPSPADIGSGGAQRIEGARISDRVAAGEPVPDGPPFDTEEQR
jgi:hypothetical protein